MNHPNFRQPNTFLNWASANKISARVETAEHVFFKEKFSEKERAFFMARYSHLVGPLPEKFEEIIFKFPKHSLAYARGIKEFGDKYQMNFNISEKHINAICDNTESAYETVVPLSKIIKKRLFDFEYKIKNPEEYVDYYSISGEIPEIEERIFFDEKIEHSSVLSSFALRLMFIDEKKSVIVYPNRLNSKRDGFSENQRNKKLLEIVKKDKKTLLDYIKKLKYREKEIPDHVLQVFKGYGEYLSRISEVMQKRLPLDIENSWKGAEDKFVNYVCSYVQEPVSEELAESVLASNPHACVRYAYNVIRGFSSPKLSEFLHNAVIMSSFADPSNREIKKYVTDIERYEKAK